MIIRLATLDDEKQIDSFDQFGGNRKLEIERNEIWVAIFSNEIAGFATFDRSFYERPFLRYLIVNDIFRRQGIAKKMLIFIESKCKNEKLFTSTEADNLPMITLLSQLNYKMVGIINELQDVGEVIYCKEIV